MPMTQDDIRSHYEAEWMRQDDSGPVAVDYCDPVEQAVAEPIYLRLVKDLGVPRGPRVLDVGSGSGRWVRFLHRALAPAVLMGTDFTGASINLLRRTAEASMPGVSFRVADITDESLELGGRFDLINIANVLFHIPEPERFDRALVNLRRHLAPGGRVLLTDYFPRLTMRTQWMMVRSRYEWEHRLAGAGLRVVAMRPMCIFSNDPMGIDGPDTGTRLLFNTVRARSRELLGAMSDERSRAFVAQMLGDIERAVLGFCEERIAPVDMPSQKLIALAAA